MPDGLNVPDTVDNLLDQMGTTPDVSVEPQMTAEQVAEEEKELEQSVQYELEDTEKQKIVEHIIKAVDDATTARAGWLEIRKETMDLLNGIRPSKSIPWPNCSNVTTMAMSTHCKLIHSKLFPSVWNENVIYWRPVEKGDIVNVERIKKFMHWVVHIDIKLQENIDTILWDLITTGTIALKTRWSKKFRTVAKKNPDTNRLEFKKAVHEYCEVENICIDEVYLPSLWKGVDDSEFIGQDVYMRYPEIQDLTSRNIFNNDIENVRPKVDERTAGSLRELAKETEGSQAIIDAHENSMPVRLVEWYMKWPIDGELKESVFTIGYESKTYMSGKPLSAVSPIGKRPWTIGRLMTRTGRPYGVSLPELMRGLCKELDAIHNQRIDAGTIAIAPWGVYRAASSFRPKKVQIGPGAMIPVDDINDVKVFELQHNPIASFQEERIIIEYLEKLTSVSAYQMGRESDIVKSRATASGTLALMSQGEQAFIILGMRAQQIVSKLLTQILQQYQMWMPAGYASRILNEEGGALLFPQGLSPEEIAGQYDAYMTLDPTVGNKSMERQANAAMLQMSTQLLTMAQDPRGYEMAKEFLQSIGKLDVERFLGPKPQQAQAGMAGAFGQGQGGGAPIGPGMGGTMPREGAAGGPQ